MNEKAVIYILWFFGYILLMFFACQWIWDAICQSAGKGPSEVMARREEICGRRKFSFKKIYAWLLERSPEPKQTKKWIVFYWIAVLLPAVGVILSVIALFTHALDNFLATASWVTMGYMFFMAIAGVVRNLIQK